MKQVTKQFDSNGSRFQNTVEKVMRYRPIDEYNEKFPKLSKRVYYFKHEEEGIRQMCSISEEFREEGRGEGRGEGRQDAILEVLQELGDVSPRLEERIRDSLTLRFKKKWLKIAVKSATTNK